jgi:putative peptide zinc metalloprotease protein
VQGTFVPAATQQIAGKFFEQGEPIGYVLSADDLKIKAALRQQDIDFASFHRSIAVRFPGHELAPFGARIGREIPAPTDVLPSASLGTMGGGRLAVDQSDPNGLLLEEPVYLVDLDLVDANIPPLVGMRTHVLFEQVPMPMAVQWAQGLRQMLMRRLDV